MIEALTLIIKDKVTENFLKKVEEAKGITFDEVETVFLSTYKTSPFKQDIQVEKDTLEEYFRYNIQVDNETLFIGYITELQFTRVFTLFSGIAHALLTDPKQDTERTMAVLNTEASQYYGIAEEAGSKCFPAPILKYLLEIM